MLLLMFAGWVNRHQLDVIEYHQDENRVLKERLGGRRLRFTDAERRRLERDLHDGTQQRLVSIAMSLNATFPPRKYGTPVTVRSNASPVPTRASGS